MHRGRGGVEVSGGRANIMRMKRGLREGCHLARVQELGLVLEEQRRVLDLHSQNLTVLLIDGVKGCCIQALSLKEGLLEHADHM